MPAKKTVVNPPPLILFHGLLQTPHPDAIRLGALNGADTAAPEPLPDTPRYLQRKEEVIAGAKSQMLRGQPRGVSAWFRCGNLHPAIYSALQDGSNVIFFIHAIPDDPEETL